MAPSTTLDESPNRTAHPLEERHNNVPFMTALTALPFSALIPSTRGLPAFIGTTFGATHRLPSIVESRYARDYIPKFQAEFGVAEEEPCGPGLGP